MLAISGAPSRSACGRGVVLIDRAPRRSRTRVAAQRMSVKAQSSCSCRLRRIIVVDFLGNVRATRRLQVFPLANTVYGMRVAAVSLIDLAGAACRLRCPLRAVLTVACRV